MKISPKLIKYSLTKTVSTNKRKLIKTLPASYHTLQIKDKYPQQQKSTESLQSLGNWTTLNGINTVKKKRHPRIQGKWIYSVPKLMGRNESSSKRKFIVLSAYT